MPAPIWVTSCLCFGNEWEIKLTKWTKHEFSAVSPSFQTDAYTGMISKRSKEMS